MSDVVLTTVVSALTNAFMLAPLALGVFLSYRILQFPDLTVDGAFGLGIVITARLILDQYNPVFAMFMGMLGGGAAGLLTAVLVVRFKIPKLLSGILVATALYSINYYVLGQAGYMFMPDDVTLRTYAESATLSLFGTSGDITFLGARIFGSRVVMMYFLGIAPVVLLVVLILFFRTRFGLAMRAAGENPSASRALGANVSLLTLTTLALANALAALSGALYSQVHPADAKDGIGMIITGLAFVLVGDALFARRRFRTRLIGALIGAILIELIISMLMLTGNIDNLMKLLQALFVFLALVLPPALRKLFKTNRPVEAAA